ncbi:ABC transporter permease [Leifsonia shinshuensis]|uniref:ABC transporter permease n=1 Tax=Leifsonia shinshuensis TaxID=150026 RepID=A0A7G6YE58_9MICO|nr:ABC transporter permease [Leifsonia shinshuensis]QNE36773.1 ABC transporter permease [Leifsonia shinshuensis]
MAQTLAIAAVKSRPARARVNWLRVTLAFLPLAIILALAVFAPLIAPYDPVTTVAASRLAPSADHLFGTDSVGMDVFSRTIYGARVAVQFGVAVAVCSTAGGILIGTFIGLSESSRGLAGWIGRFLNQVSDYFIAIPSIILGIVVVGIMGSSPVALIIAITLCLIQATIKLTRAEVLRVRREGYLEAAELAGESPLRAAFVHVVPNSIGPAMRNMPLVFGNCVIILASLGFIGVGVKAPTPEWGYMISSGISSLMLGRWWPTVFPAIFVALSVLAIAHSSRAIPQVWPYLAAHVKKRYRTERKSRAH